MSLLRAIPTKEEACTVKLGLMSAQRALTTFHRGHYFVCGPFHTIIYPIPHDQLSFPPFLLLYIPLLSPVPCTSPHTTQTRQSIGCPFVPPWCNSEASLCLCVVPPVAYTLRALGAGVLLPSFFRLTLTGVLISATLCFWSISLSVMFSPSLSLSLARLRSKPGLLGPVCLFWSHPWVQCCL